jgi:PTS system beta-glucosides-specific IIC component
MKLYKLNRRREIMSKKNYDELSKNIVKCIGGVDNVNSLFHCATRLRFQVKDKSIVDKEKLNHLEGVITVIEGSGQIQVVIGNQVGDVYEAVIKNTGIKGEANQEATQAKEKKNLISGWIYRTCSI